MRRQNVLRIAWGVGLLAFCLGLFLHDPDQGWDTWRVAETAGLAVWMPAMIGYLLLRRRAQAALAETRRGDRG
jgi:hypothetical protein